MSGSQASVRKATLYLTTTNNLLKTFANIYFQMRYGNDTATRIMKKHKQYKTQHFSLSALTFNEEYINNKHWWTETDTIPMN